VKRSFNMIEEKIPWPIVGLFIGMTGLGILFGLYLCINLYAHYRCAVQLDCRYQEVRTSRFAS